VQEDFIFPPKIPNIPKTSHCWCSILYHYTLNLLDLLPQYILQEPCIASKFGNTLPKFLDCHLVLVEVEPERSLIIDITLLRQIEATSFSSVKFDGDRIV
jgi:hypothetical protein